MFRPTACLVAATILASACVATNYEECGTRVEPAAPTFAWTETVLPIVAGATPEFDTLPRPYVNEPVFAALSAATGSDFTLASITYHLPSPPLSTEGIVALFDGGGGAGLWFETTEGRLITEGLVTAGYAVLGFDMVVAPGSGIENNWRNVDLYEPHVAEVGAAVQVVQNQIGGGDLPLFTIGFSKGGGFASFAHRDLPATGQVLFNTTGHEAAFDGTDPAFVAPPPTMWILGVNDDPPVRSSSGVPLGTRNQVAQDYHDALAQNLGIAELHHNEVAHPSEVAFRRIALADGTTVSLTGSEHLFDEMTAHSPPLIVFDADGCPVVSAPSNAWLLTGFDWGTVPTSVEPELERQNDELGAYHQITSDFLPEIVTFFQSAP